MTFKRQRRGPIASSRRSLQSGMTETVLLRQIEKTGDNNRHHRDNADHAHQLDEIARISTISAFKAPRKRFHLPKIAKFSRQLV